ncbi:MAG: SsrA-binding protein SmpB [Patescibacteria group bacterium]
MSKVFASNKKAFFDYSFKETLEVGIRLTGPEVKSVKASSVNMSGSFVMIENGTLVLKNMHIGPYKPANQEGYNPTGDRDLLAHKKEILRLALAREKEGLTIVPTKIYGKGRMVKVEIAIGKGKKKHDKREDIKKKDIERDLRRGIS